MDKIRLNPKKDNKKNGNKIGFENSVSPNHLIDNPNVVKKAKMALVAKMHKA